MNRGLFPFDEALLGLFISGAIKHQQKMDEAHLKDWVAVLDRFLFVRKTVTAVLAKFIGLKFRSLSCEQLTNQ
ncbi:MAG: hypothetical protein WAT12_05880 [Candidatus Nitrotoga sp.]